jgi:hypothetical protein
VTLPCHLFISWHLARHITPDATKRRWIAGSGLAADLDGMGVLVDNATGSTQFYQEWHHLLGHNLFVGVLLATMAGYFCRSGAAAAWAWVSFHIHLAGDLVTGRGPDGSGWPVVYGWPLSAREWQWAGQIRLDAWPNTALVLVLMAWAVVAAYRTGRSPAELVSSSLDQRIVGAFRAVWSARRARSQTAPDGHGGGGC